MTMRLNVALAAAALLGAAGLGAVGGAAMAAQPRMYAARDALVAARNELVAATNQKGGHRAKALRLVNEAIHEVDEGIRFDATH